MTILVFAAMSKERALLEGALAGARRAVRAGIPYVAGKAGGASVVVAETGIGKVNAAIGAVEAIRAWKPDCAVSCGVAGGLRPGLKPADVVAATEIAYHDVDCGPGNEPGQVQGLPPRFACDARLARAAASVAAASGVFASGDEFVRSARRRDAILRRVPGAIAVDMESGALAQACFLRGVPFAALRVLSDVPGAAPDHAAQYENFWDALAGRSFDAAGKFLALLGA